MLCVDKEEEEDDLFFDSVDYMSYDGQEEKLNSSKLDYEIWCKEPQSVKQRRQSFFCEMGLVEFDARSRDIPDLDRITRCSGAVSSSSASCSIREDRDVFFCEREGNSEASSMVDEIDQHQFVKPFMINQCGNSGSSPPMQLCEQGEVEDCENLKVEKKKKMKSWWRELRWKRKEIRGTCVSKPETPETNIVKVKQSKKSWMEFTGIYKGQEIQAHNSLIRTMKINPDGQYLATGGGDVVVCIWNLRSVDVYLSSLASDVDCSSKLTYKKSKLTTKKINLPSVIIPDKVFQIEESPLQKLHGHTSDVLDLAWSNTNYLLSSSMDKTVRLWKLGSDHCLHVFRHSNYVTCIQFNPVNQNYFISGSIDGKVRIWGLDEKRVVDWVDVRDVISALCYQPDAKGFAVGCLTGSCHFYEVSGSELQLEAELNCCTKKRTSGNRITSIQFVDEISKKVMITSEDSKVRIFDGFDIVAKFKGLPKSGSQMSASFTPARRHIISAGEDSRVYVWNYGDLCTPSSKHVVSVRSCEHFYAEGVTIAVPWSSMRRDLRSARSDDKLHSHIQREECASSWRRDPDQFSLGNCFFMNGHCRGSSATWPEEKLPFPEVENEHHQDLHHRSLEEQQVLLSEAWGLVILTAGSDGKIKTFHNYGLPIKL